MPKTKQRKTKKKQIADRELRYRLIAILILFILLIAALKTGAVGIFLDNIFGYILGVFAGVMYLIGIILCIYVIYEGNLPSLTGPKAIGLYLIIFSTILLASAPSNKSIVGFDVFKQFQLETQAVRGGLTGAILYSILSMLFDHTGTLILCILFILVGLAFIIGRTYLEVMRKKIKEQELKLKNTQLKKPSFSSEKPKKRVLFPDKIFDDGIMEDELEEELNETPVYRSEIKPITIHPVIEKEPQIIEEANVDEKKEEVIEETTEEIKEDLPFDTTDLSAEHKVNENYVLPPMSLLKHTKANRNQKNEASHLARENADKLTRVLHEFGVNAKVSEIYIGPAVTKYELVLETGTRVNRISSLTDDIKMALAAKDIRIEAPIPGKSAVGIEIPNVESSTVPFRDVLKDVPEKKKNSKLLVPLGKDVMGMSVFAELDKMPHLLIAGATGSGKSVCVNGIICSLLMRAKPDEVKLMLVDPKKVELSNYNGIPHLISPVITDPKKAAKALRVVVMEMERRYEVFASANARNITSYNEYAKMHNESCEEVDKKEVLPYIVVILDEVADLMMVASKDVEDCIMRISQMARAAGIHLIVATQRPSTDVITGVVKANIPSRIAFAVSSQIDSRTILDMAGAEKLLGKGDMLFSPMGASAPIRVQGSYVSDEEVEAIVKFVSTQQEASFDDSFVNLDTSNSSSGYDDVDEEYEDCRDFVIQVQKASASLLQRQFRIGYNKAARIIDQLEANGVIGPQIGSKPREVFIRKYEEEEI